jgi:hypothetical protein
MTDQSTSDLERDAERVRAQIADTAEHLKDKMSPGQMMDEVFNYFKDGDTSEWLGNLKHQVRDNPMALALVGSGLAWLMMGSGPNGTTGLPSRNPLAGDGSNRRPLAGSNTYGGSAGTPTSAADGSTLGQMGDKVGDMAGSVADAAARTLHDIRDGAADSFSHASQTASDGVHRAKSSFLDALDREPLVLGALGVAVGAAIGAMLPPTKLEQDYLGEASSNVREGAEQLAADGIEKAKQVASDAYAAARDEADEQGLMPHGKPLSEKLAKVAEAAGAEIKAAAGDMVDQVEAAAESASDKWSPSGNRF